MAGVHPARRDAGPTTVSIVSLGCARNDVDSEELAARLADGGFELVGEPADAEVVVVNTCGFVEQAKKDSIDTLLAAAGLKDAGRDGEGDPGGRARAVVAVGCLAERYGAELAQSLPEADAVLGFDDYPDIAARLREILDGDAPAPRQPVDRRRLLPTTPLDRPAAWADDRHAALVAIESVRPGASETIDGDGGRGGPRRGGEGRPGRAREAVSVPGHGRPSVGTSSAGPASGPVLRRRLDDGPSAPLKIASGCDRRCAFCAIPSFRGSYLSRPADEIVAEAHWLVEQGVKEAVLVSENSSSYGKDLGQPQALERLLERLAGVDGLEWIRVSYLQPAELRPSLIEALTGVPHVVPYFDLPFQHASARVLKRMRRYGDPESFLRLLEAIRTRAPRAGIRTNVIVGFPGETQAELQELADFLAEAKLDAIGVFGYSDEDGTEAATLDGHLDADEIAARVEWLTALTDELGAQRAEDRVGERVRLLVEETGVELVARAEHQGPQTDGATLVRTRASRAAIGDMLNGVVVGCDGVDLIAEVEG